MAIDDNTSYELTGAQVKDLANKIKAKADDNIFVGATSATPGSKGLVPAPQGGDDSKVLLGDGTWGDATAKLVEMSYGESGAWAKFIAAYNAGSIVYCRASSNANPATGSQTRKAFMAYVNNAASPTNVEFQYVRSVGSKSDSQQCDQVFVYKLTNSNGGTWTVETRDMATKINVGSTLVKTYNGGANASMTLGAKAMTGATSSAAGAAGVVPAPAAGDNTKFLRGDGTWQTVGGGTAYSTSEVATNDTWLNGETIYRKTFTMNSSYGTVAHGITNLSRIIKVESVLNDGTMGDHSALSYAQVVPYQMVADGNWSFEVDNTNITINEDTHHNFDYPSIFVTLYYIKSSSEGQGGGAED